MRASRRNPTNCRRLTAALAACIALFGAAANGEVLHRERSLYRNIVIYEEDGLRCMAFGRSRDARQSCVSLSHRDELVFNYARMAMGALYLAPAPQSILILGLGGGTLATAFQKLLPSAAIDAVEVDPAVVRMALRYFDFVPGPQTQVFEEDGRVFVKRMMRKGTKYDLIVLDAFDHEYIPEHMLTREFLLEVRSLLTERGVLVGNTFSSSRLYDHESATYYSVFGDFYNLKKNNRLIILRNDGLPSKADLARNAELLDAQLKTVGVDKAWLLPQFEIERSWRPRTRVLTDQYSPSNLLNAQP
jgi:spermidine synthase